MRLTGPLNEPEICLTAFSAASIHERRPFSSPFPQRMNAMSSPATSQITSLLNENRSFPPPPEFVARAHVKSLAEYEKLWQRAKDDPEGFWAEQAESLHWFKRWDKVLVWNEPHAQWFTGGQLNASYNCLDRHLENGRKNKAEI